MTKDIRSRIYAVCLICGWRISQYYVYFYVGIYVVFTIIVKILVKHCNYYKYCAYICI